MGSNIWAENYKWHKFGGKMKGAKFERQNQFRKLFNDSDDGLNDHGVPCQRCPLFLGLCLNDLIFIHSSITHPPIKKWIQTMSIEQDKHGYKVKPVHQLQNSTLC